MERNINKDIVIIHTRRRVVTQKERKRMLTEIYIMTYGNKYWNNNIVMLAF